MNKLPYISVGVFLVRLTPGLVFSISLLEQCFDNVDIFINPHKSELDKLEYKIGYSEPKRMFQRPNGISYSDFGITWSKFGYFFCEGDLELLNFLENEFVAVIDTFSTDSTVNDSDFLSHKTLDLKFLIDIFNPSFVEGKVDIDSHFNDALNFGHMILDRIKVYGIQKVSVLGAQESKS